VLYYIADFHQPEEKAARSGGCEDLSNNGKAATKTAGQVTGVVKAAL
jgi:hypothetical protein